MPVIHAFNYRAYAKPVEYALQLPAFGALAAASSQWGREHGPLINFLFLLLLPLPFVLALLPYSIHAALDIIPFARCPKVISAQDRPHDQDPSKPCSICCLGGGVPENAAHGFRLHRRHGQVNRENSNSKLRNPSAPLPVPAIPYRKRKEN
jgi:hypothetical protein